VRVRLTGHATQALGIACDTCDSPRRKCPASASIAGLVGSCHQGANLVVDAKRRAPASGWQMQRAAVSVNRCAARQARSCNLAGIDRCLDVTLEFPV
jgi:hypothetical protein